MPKPPSTQPTPLPEPVPTPPVEITEDDSSSTEHIQSEPIDDSEQSSDDDVVQSQILGIPQRKSIGLQPIEIDTRDESVSNGLSDKAQELVDESKLRAKDDENPPEEEKKSGVVSAEVIQVESVKPKRPAPRPRRNRNSFQPAARAKRLDRSRHMEYKYEVRRLMADIDVLDEHRSNILGTMWAKGERQTIVDAKKFLENKLSEGILTDGQLSKLSDVLDKYTVRR